MITTTSLKHPSIRTKIIAAAKIAMYQGYPDYVVNRNGKVIFRVGFDGTTLRCFAGNKDITTMVRSSF